MAQCGFAESGQDRPTGAQGLERICLDAMQVCFALKQGFSTLALSTFGI